VIADVARQWHMRRLPCPADNGGLCMPWSKHVSPAANISKAACLVDIDNNVDEEQSNDVSKRE